MREPCSPMLKIFCSASSTMAATGRPLRVEGVGRDLVAGADQLAQDRALAHDLGITADVAGAGHVLRQRIQVGQPPTSSALPWFCRCSNTVMTSAGLDWR
jgi:hypothetical protein